jgi:DNA-binding NarL/FixJ family response regulator
LTDAALPGTGGPASHGGEPSVTVLTVDDQAVFLRAMRRLIAASPGFHQVGEARSGPEGLRLAVELEPDAILLDVRMPGMDGIETARRLAEIVPGALIILVSLDPVPDLSGERPLPGTAAYVRKQDLSARSLGEIWSAHGHPVG